jgi:hypothetical protein
MSCGRGLEVAAEGVAIGIGAISGALALTVADDIAGSALQNAGIAFGVTDELGLVHVPLGEGEKGVGGCTSHSINADRGWQAVFIKRQEARGHGVVLFLHDLGIEVGNRVGGIGHGAPFLLKV